VLVNGYPALMTELVADGSIGSFTFDLDIARSSWVSRPFPSWNRSILTEICLCHACSCQDILRTETAGQVACRILPSSHTNPIFVLVGEQPIRAYRRSVEWCLQGEPNGRI
jgi:hypothetical protein